MAAVRSLFLLAGRNPEPSFPDTGPKICAAAAASNMVGQGEPPSCQYEVELTRCFFLHMKILVFHGILLPIEISEIRGISDPKSTLILEDVFEQKIK